MLDLLETVTVSYTAGANFPELFIGEFNIGGHAANRDGTTTGNSQGTTTAFQSASITTTNNPDILVCFYGNNGSLNRIEFWMDSECL